LKRFAADVVGITTKGIVPDVRPARISSGLRQARTDVFSAIGARRPLAAACARVISGPAGGPKSVSSGSGVARAPRGSKDIAVIPLNEASTARLEKWWKSLNSFLL
jgi:hypothetical protein